MTVKILTPEGGTPQYVIALALRNNVIGSVTFTDKTDAAIFLENYEKLKVFRFGHLELQIDCTEDDENEIQE